MHKHLSLLTEFVIKLVTTLDHHPKGAFALVVMMAIGVAGVYFWKRK